MAVAGCCTSVSFSWHCSPPELGPGAQIAAEAAAVADCGKVQGEAEEEAGLFPTAAVVAAGNVAHQWPLTPCRTSSAPPLVVTCGGVAS